MTLEYYKFLKKVEQVSLNHGVIQESNIVKTMRTLVIEPVKALDYQLLNTMKKE